MFANAYPGNDIPAEQVTQVNLAPSLRIRITILRWLFLIVIPVVVFLLFLMGSWVNDSSSPAHSSNFSTGPSKFTFTFSGVYKIESIADYARVTEEGSNGEVRMLSDGNVLKTITNNGGENTPHPHSASAAIASSNALSVYSARTTHTSNGSNYSPKTYISPSLGKSLYVHRQENLRNLPSSFFEDEDFPAQFEPDYIFFGKKTAWIDYLSKLASQFFRLKGSKQLADGLSANADYPFKNAAGKELPGEVESRAFFSTLPPVDSKQLELFEVEDKRSLSLSTTKDNPAALASPFEGTVSVLLMLRSSVLWGMHLSLLQLIFSGAPADKNLLFLEGLNSIRGESAPFKGFSNLKYFKVLQSFLASNTGIEGGRGTGQRQGVSKSQKVPDDAGESGIPDFCTFTARLSPSYDKNWEKSRRPIDDMNYSTLLRTASDTSYRREIVRNKFHAQSNAISENVSSYARRLYGNFMDYFGYSSENSQKGIVGGSEHSCFSDNGGLSGCGSHEVIQKQPNAEPDLLQNPSPKSPTKTPHQSPPPNPSTKPSSSGTSTQRGASPSKARRLNSSTNFDSFSHPSLSIEGGESQNVNTLRPAAIFPYFTLPYHHQVATISNSLRNAVEDYLRYSVSVSWVLPLMDRGLKAIQALAPPRSSAENCNSTQEEALVFDQSANEKKNPSSHTFQSETNSTSVLKRDQGLDFSLDDCWKDEDEAVISENVGKARISGVEASKIAFSPPSYSQKNSENHIKTTDKRALASSLAGGTAASKPHADSSSLVLNVVSLDCNVSIEIWGAPFDYEKLIGDYGFFSFFFNLKCIAELMLIWFQIKRCESSAYAAKISLLSIGVSAAIDMFEIFFLVFIGATLTVLLGYCIIMCLFKFIHFFFLEVRYIAVVWRARHPEILSEQYETLSRRIAPFAFLFLCGIIAWGALAFAAALFFPLALPFFYLIWVPQIVYDIWKGQRNSINVTYLVLLSFCRWLLPAYLFGNLHIFSNEYLKDLSISGNFKVSLIIFLVLVVQLVIMSGQRRFGSRFFVPLKCLPHVYDYLRRFSIDMTEQGEIDCVICINKIDAVNRKVCITPCDHIFHTDCLRQWMEVKLECPTCRRSLPFFA